MSKQSESKTVLAHPSTIGDVIHTIRGQKAILGRDLALIYGVQTKALTQAVKRNIKKFPPDFMFRLTLAEAKEVERSRSQIVTLKRGANVKYLPYAFTEHGVVMAANVLNSDRAVTMSVYVVRVFVKLRESIIGTEALQQKLEELERKLTARQNDQEKAILVLFKQIRELLLPHAQERSRKTPIGFRTGQKLKRD